MFSARKLILSLALGTSLISLPATARANYITDAKMEASCKGFDGLQFTATGLQPNKQYTAVFTINAVCPNSPAPTIKTVKINFVTPSTTTPGGAAFTSSDFIQVGNPNCNVSGNPSGYCLVPNLAINPGLDYSPILGIYDPLSLNPGSPITNNGCQVNATATLTSDPASVFTVNVDGYTAPSRQTIACTCPPDSTGATSQLIDTLAVAGPNNFAVFGLGGASALVTVTSNSSVTGNVGVGNPGTLQESSSSNVTGNLIVGSTVNTSGVHGSHDTTVVEDSVLSSALGNANADAAYFATLTSTPSVQSQFPSNGVITGNLTINLVPGIQNVVNLSNFDLNNGSHTLTFNGTAGTSLIINDSGTFNLDSGTIAVSGGMGPLDVLYNITNPTATVVTSSPTTAVGILLAPNNNTTMSSTNFTGEVISGHQRTIALMSTTVINPCALQQTCNGGRGDGSWGNGGWSSGSWSNGSWGNWSWGNGNWGNWRWNNNGDWNWDSNGWSSWW